MSSSLRRGALAAAAIAFVLPLAACGAGNNAQTLGVRPDHAATSVGDIEIQNAILITQPDRESTGPAAVSATVFNSGRTDQTLESIRVDGTDLSAELKPAEGSGDVVVPAGGSVILGGEGNASAELPNGGQALRQGDAQKVTFSFSETGDVSLEAFVVPAEGYYASWGPSDVPAAPGASGKPSADESDPAQDSHGEPAEGGSDHASGTPSGAESGPAAGSGTESGAPGDAASASAGATATAGAGH
ncbi:DUF461 domain-containing protein [Streptomyces sp. HMX87]|uniref:DUF461 domain-containing protein n=1 Tax=Streptomyces sp. HMX87 TaxID=3390849 RepID=UPI003A850795